MPHRRANGWIVSTIALVILASCGDGVGRREAEPALATAPRPPEVADTTAPAVTTTPQPPPSPAAVPPTYPTGIEPARLEIPAIGVDATVVPLDLSGPEPEVPADFGTTGWYRQTRLPGEIGPSVIAGHIDSRDGPAVFHRLDRLSAGDEIVVHAATGEARTFVVSGSGQYPKDGLPPEVFGFDAAEPQLRLITCGGTFDRSTGHYRDNLVVYAHQA